MPKSKKKRKKGANNKALSIRHLHRQARDIANNHLLVYVPFIAEAIDPHNNNGDNVNFTKEAVEAVENTPILWSISCYVLCRDQNGGEYMKPMITTAPYPCKRQQIMESMADEFMEHVKKQNQDHILTVGWIATTKGNEPTDEVADKIFSKIGVWKEFLTNHEERKLDNEISN